MSILIKGMEMPQSCYDCDFQVQVPTGEHSYEWLCSATQKYLCGFSKEDNGCPLTEIPDGHGKLGLGR